MFTHLIVWLWIAGLLTLAGGLVAGRKQLLAAKGLEKLVVLGPVFFAAPLAVFGAEHLTNAQAISQIVPAWMPGRVFWTYFVGIALTGGAVSLALRIWDSFSAALLGSMFVCFVLMIHLPNVGENFKNRIIWAVALRDIAFAGGAFSLAAQKIDRLRVAARILVAVPLLFFAVEHFLHPQFAPGVPLAKMTPEWVPIRAFWGYLTGAGLLISGASMLMAARHSRLAAQLLGLLITLLVVFLYLPIFLAAPRPMLLEGINYLADTMLFGGTVLLASTILPDRAASAPR